MNIHKENLLFLLTSSPHAMVRVSYAMVRVSTHHCLHYINNQYFIEKIYFLLLLPCKIL